MLFRKKEVKKVYDREKVKPVIKASICTGEQVAGFLDVHTGAFEDICLIRNQSDLDRFMKMYGIEGRIDKIY